jgi:4-nitrophenyl phosphatase
MIPITIKALILDMDGVIWKDDQPIGDLPKIFDQIYIKGIKVAFATNNSSRSNHDYIERLKKFGITQVEFYNVITSSTAMVYELSQRFPLNADFYVIGERGLKESIKQAGFNVYENNPLKNIHAVVVGIDRNISYEKLKNASLLIRKGIPFFGTNPDKTFPTPDGLVPGAGSILAAITAATEVNPIVFGKPSPVMIRMAREILGVEPFETLVVGDRIETDIASGQADGCKTALVLSGVSTTKDLEKWNPPADICVSSLSALVDFDG